ncbi:hypothetical protein [Streptomyces sp. NPDC058629]|uniref:hypothetical protein n=1 Tax=Streptomyces sp. NPDC058629 TaxID=3346565 RepID=UPI00365EAC18
MFGETPAGRASSVDAQPSARRRHRAPLALSGPCGNGSFTGQVPYVGDALNDAVTYVKSGAADTATVNH